ncbi:phytase [Paenibacillus sp. YPG26]|uniref:phytase n=1 Tax=Paenibacillus sp. YPG26 TaxID=2878915 RepID=UPI00203FA5DB|nr:phytase [Paenibacillus sp. YPG26]USB33117.1 phytase [Paenibacillus sp. YPG26]
MSKVKVLLASTILAGMMVPAASAAANTADYVGLRQSLEKIGASISWDVEDRAASFKLSNGISGLVTVDEAKYRLAGKEAELSLPVKLVNGKTLIPASLLQSIIAENNKYRDAKDAIPTFTVKAQGETEAVDSKSGEDAADDPAIWLDPQNPAGSKLVATNKAGGILVYDMNGKQLQSYPVGKMNNIDLRYDFPLGGQKVDIVAATNRSTNTIDVFTITGATGELKSVVAEPIKSKMGEVYGFSLYHSLKTGKFYALVLGKEGEFEQYELTDNGSGKIAGKLVREFQLSSQSEGMVADDEYGNLYIAEEDVAIWKYDAEPDGSAKPKLTIDIADGRRLQDDIEGLTLYYGKDGAGYLIASSQGSNSYAIYNRTGDNAYISNFTIGDGDQIDGTSETDGIDVLGVNLGDRYPNGVFVSQDDSNMHGGKELNQNFKLVSWDQIANGPASKLESGNGANPRQLVNRSAK